MLSKILRLGGAVQETYGTQLSSTSTVAATLSHGATSTITLI